MPAKAGHGMKRRLSFLDAMRGIASLVVVFSHIHFTASEQTDWLRHAFARAIINSSFAVALFFTLSGMVLFMQLRGEHTGYIQFVVRRAFRLLPAVVAVVTISYAIYLIWSPGPVASLGPWFNEVSWPEGIDFESYLRHLVLVGPCQLLRPLWSLVIEWRVSLVFPLIVLFYTAMPSSTVAAFACFAVLFSQANEWFVGHSSAVVAFFASIFLLGIILGERWREITLFLRRNHSAKIAIGTVCAYYLLIRHQDDSLSGWLASGIISALLIAFCMSTSKARMILRLSPLQYLGRISYSLYLVHIIWIGVLFRVMQGYNVLLIGALVIFASVISADLLQRFVEAPFNRLGRHVANGVSARIQTMTLSKRSLNVR